MCSSHSPSSALDPQGNDLSAGGVHVVIRGLIGFAWACAPKSLTREQVEQTLLATEQHYIPGETPWTVTSRRSEDPGLVSPGPCREDPEGRQHWFLIGGLTGFYLLAASGETAEELGIPEDLAIRLSL